MRVGPKMRLVSYFNEAHRHALGEHSVSARGNQEQRDPRKQKKSQIRALLRRDQKRILVLSREDLKKMWHPREDPRKMAWSREDPRKMLEKEDPKKLLDQREVPRKILALNQTQSKGQKKKHS